MDIFFEAKRVFYNHTGLGNYSRWLLDEYAKRYKNDDLVLLKPGFQKSSFLIPYSNAPFQIKTYRNPFGLQRTFTLYQYSSDHSVFHGLSAELPIFPTNKNIQKIVTIHDLIFLERKYDYAFMDRMIYVKKLENAIHQADQILCVSEFTKKQLLKYYPLIESKITVIYQNCNYAFYSAWTSENIIELKKKYAIPEHYWLCVSSFNPRKNLQSIVEAYRTIPDTQRIPFLFIGKGKDSEKLKVSIQKFKLDQYFIFLDRIPSEELPGFYQGSIGLIYPSLIEGFGIPAVEAMASQIPVICHHHTVLEEVTQGTGISVNCNNREEFSNAILELQSNSFLRHRLIQNAQSALQKFDNDYLMQEYHKIYNSNF